MWKPRLNKLKSRKEIKNIKTIDLMLKTQSEQMKPQSSIV